MKRISYWVLSTVSALVLLFGYHTSTSSQMPSSTEAPYVASGTTSTSRTASTAAAGSGSGSGGSGSGGTTSSSSATPRSSASKAGRVSTVTGDTVQTRWGPVQVSLTMKGSAISKVTVLQYPNGNPRDAEINAQALPILIQETQSAQSARIDMVSGATYTSDGYIQSLQSALDKVNA